MDSFDDFELKPLSQGLGFHKKPVNLGESIKKSEASKDHLKKSIPKRPASGLLDSTFMPEKETTYEDLLASLSSPKKSTAFQDLFSEETHSSENSSSQETSPSAPIFTSTLPRKSSDISLSSTEVFEDPVGTNIFPETPRKTPTPPPDAPIRDEVDKNNISISSDIFKSKQQGVRRGAHDAPPISRLSKAPICLRSLFLDVLVVLAMALVFLLSLLIVTKVDLMSVWASSKNDLMTQLSMAVLYIAVYQMYVVISRSFFGRTLGEWTFDFQLGNDEQQKKALYPVKVLWRSLLVIMTGVVILPLFSFIFRKDLASYLTGLQLYEQK